MNGYSKIRVATNFTSKSRSVDFSDLSLSLPQVHEECNPETKTTSRSIEGQVKAKPQYHFPGQEEEVGEESCGERFGVILSRSCSSASQRFRASERSHGGTLQAVARRAFSMRKPSSVAGGYWRIHDTCDDGGGDMVHDGEEQQQQQEQEAARPSRKKRGRFLKACKRLLGF